MIAADLVISVSELAAFILGVLVSLVVTVFWMGCADVLWEYFIEHAIDRFSPCRTDCAIISDGPVEILLSDLHIDSWEPDSIDSQRGRISDFVELLELVRSDSKIIGFVVNGDLMEVPAFAGEYASGIEGLLLPTARADTQRNGQISPHYDPILSALSSLAPTPTGEIKQGGVRRFIIQTGNHDTGVQGVQMAVGYNPSKQLAWNPQIVIESQPGSDTEYPNWVYIEHGHFYDPFLWLYARFSVLDILHSGEIAQRDGAFLRGMQRNSARANGHIPRQKTPRNSKASSMGAQEHWDFADDSHSFWEWMVIYHYRHAARKAFSAFKRNRKPCIGSFSTGSGLEKVRTVTFGHTHLPDRYVFPGGNVYVNSGDWCGNEPHQCYSIIQSDGSVVGPFQWITASQAAQRHNWTISTKDGHNQND